MSLFRFKRRAKYHLAMLPWLIRRKLVFLLLGEYAEIPSA